MLSSPICDWHRHPLVSNHGLLFFPSLVFDSVRMASNMNTCYLFNALLLLCAGGVKAFFPQQQPLFGPPAARPLGVAPTQSVVGGQRPVAARGFQQNTLPVQPGTSSTSQSKSLQGAWGMLWDVLCSIRKIGLEDKVGKGKLVGWFKGAFVLWSCVIFWFRDCGNWKFGGIV